jgi:hypothetical protein
LNEPEPEPVAAPATAANSQVDVLGMPFDHERLDVLALEFLVLAERMIQALPKGRSHVADQLTRSSITIVLNVAGVLSRCS